MWITVILVHAEEMSAIGYTVCRICGDHLYYPNPRRLEGESHEHHGALQEKERAAPHGTNLTAISLSKGYRRG